MRLFVLLLFLVDLSYSAQFVAVLETLTDGEAGVSSSALRYLTDELRKQALNALPTSAGFSVMTRENIQAMLPPGKTLEECAGECMVETGRNLNADFVAQARVGKVGSRLALTVELYETRSAKLVASFTERCAGIDDLIDKVSQQSPVLFGTVRGGAPNSNPNPNPNPNPDQVGTNVTVEFSDGPAVVLFDGGVACSNKERCTKELSPGQHAVAVSRDSYRDSSFAITVPMGSNRYRLALVSKAGVLTLRANDSEGSAVTGQVIVDGRNLGNTPWSGAVPVTASKIVVRADGYVDAEVSDRPDEGKKIAITIILKNRPDYRQKLTGNGASPGPEAVQISGDLAQWEDLVDRCKGRQDERCAGALRSLGFLQYQLEEKTNSSHQKSLDYFLKFIKVYPRNPNMPKVLNQAADILASVGESEKANRLRLKLIEDWPNDVLVPKIKQDLGK